MTSRTPEINLPVLNIAPPVVFSHSFDGPDTQLRTPATGGCADCHQYQSVRFSAEHQEEEPVAEAIQSQG